MKFSIHPTRLCGDSSMESRKSGSLHFDMDKKRLEWRVGLFVFIGLAVLGVMLLQFSKGASLFRPAYDLYLKAKNVGSLKTRASVLMSGVQIGTVSDIQLNPE